MQCKEWLKIANGRDKTYMIDDKKIVVINQLLQLFVMAKGLKANQTVYQALAGFQWLLS